MKNLTKRQEEVLGFIKQFIKTHKYPPTIREIAKQYSISVKGAYDHVKALEKKKKIHCNLNRSRTIEIVEDEAEMVNVVEIPILGNVAAGLPLLAEENLDGTLQIPRNLLSASAKYFALHVRGDSMQGAGILDGDTAVIQQQQVADNGDIVVAMLNGEAVTLKRFFREKNRVKLKAENPVYPPIYTQDLRILGRLVQIIRQY